MAWASPTRQFVLLSLLTIGGSTLLFGFALVYFVERGILASQRVEAVPEERPCLDRHTTEQALG